MSNNKYNKKLDSKKLVVLFLLLFTMNVLLAQENSISPLFALSNSDATGFSNDINAVNQKLGSYIKIESFSNTNLLGLNYTVSTQQTSNVDKLFILSAPNSLVVYDLPYFFDPNYNGQKTGLTLPVSVTDIDYHHKSATIYAYSLTDQKIYNLLPFSGAVQTSINVPFASLPEDFAIKTNNDFVVLKAEENDSTKLLFHSLLDNTNTEIVLNTLYKSFYLVSYTEIANFYAVAKDLNDVNWLLEIDPTTKQVNTISALPSCSNCIQENYSFDPNALALDWENNLLIAVLNQNIGGVDNYSLLSINLTDGTTLNNVSLSKRMSNLYFNKAAADLVFPGDANHDGIVNTRDLLPIGLRYSFNTTARFTQNIDWVGQHSFNTGYLAQGADIKHADCNGDGQINSLDIDAIKANYTSVHNSNKSLSIVAAEDCDYPLGFSFIESAYENNDVIVNIKLGESFDPVVAVYGVSFTVYYDNSFVVPNSMHTNGLNSWFGNDGGNCIHVSQDNFLSGKIDITITGINLVNRSGGGDFIQIAWTMEDDVIPIAVQTGNMNLRIEDIYIINVDEEELDGCGTDTTLEVSRKNMVGIEKVNPNQIKIYPNPTSSKIIIDAEITIKSLELFSITGKKIKSLSLDKTNTVDVIDLAKGIYMLKVNTNEASFFEKIVIQ